MFLNSITGYKISQKHLHYNDTHKASFLTIEIQYNPEFIEDERFFEGTSGQLRENRFAGISIFLDQFPLYSQIRQWFSTHSFFG